MKNLILALLFLGTSVSNAAILLKVGSKGGLGLPGISVSSHGTMDAGGILGGTDWESCALGSRATVGTVDTAATEDHIAIGFLCTSANQGTGPSSLVDPTNMVIAPRNSNGRVNYELRDGTGAVTARGGYVHNESSGTVPPFLMRIGHSSGAASLDTTTGNQPIFHLDPATYDGGTVTVAISGKLSPCPTGGTRARIKICQINNNTTDFGPAFACPENPISSTYLGNGVATYVFDIEMAEFGAEVLCEHDFGVLC